MSDFLKEQLISELTTEVSPEILQFVEKIVQDFPFQPVAVLFYGSNLRTNNLDGILDFYIITEKKSDYPAGAGVKLLNRILPPYVYYQEEKSGNKILRAKIACISYEQLLKKSFLHSYDTTIWARFCQPTRLVWVRDPQKADDILDFLRNCLITAASWAALLGPQKATKEEFWHSLFAHTYHAELRVEKKKRSHHILEGYEARYGKILLAVWAQINLKFIMRGEEITPHLTDKSRIKARKKWHFITKLGKIFNFLRLLKAASSFKGGMGYLLWKIKRHTGKEIMLSDFEKKHPLITLPFILWKFRSLKK